MKPLPKPADADTDAGCLAKQGASSQSVSDTVTRLFPPPDGDTDRQAMQPIMSGRPDSDACPLLPDSSLRQPHEPDLQVLLAENETTSKLVLTSVSQ